MKSLAKHLPISLKRRLGILPARVKIGTQKRVGPGEPTFVIAEIGNNHNGDFDLALRTIKAAAECGADAVKFQKRDVQALLSKEMRDMPYENERSFGKTYGEHREKQELGSDQYRRMKEYAESLNLIFFATPFEPASADVLESIGVHAYKIASFDVTNIPLLIHVAKKGKPILLSTGAATLEETDAAISTILAHNDRLIVNHCTSMYPTPDDKVNLNMMRTLATRYDPLPVGYSGHEPDILPTVVAVGMGARLVERHFTLDRNMRGSDHHMSIEPAEFADMVRQIRRVETLLGSSDKQVYEGELPVRAKHLKSIASKRALKKGERLREEDLTYKTPGTGLLPSQASLLVGRIVPVDIDADTILPKDALTWRV